MIRAWARGAGRLAFFCGLAGAGYLSAHAMRAQGHVSLSPAPLPALELDTLTELVAGAADAEVVVRIFGDYGCPGCRALDRTLGDTLLSLARAGRIRLVYLQRPLASNAAGEAMALAVACAPAGTAWEVHRRLYREPATGPGRPGDRLPGAITQTAQFERCLASDAVRQRARASIVAAREAGFHEVPVVLVGGARVRYRTHRALLRHIVGMLP